MVNGVPQQGDIIKLNFIIEYNTTYFHGLNCSNYSSPTEYTTPD